MAWQRPFLRRPMSRRTGAAFTALVVKSPATWAGVSEQIRPRSLFPSFLIPAATPAKRKPGTLKSSGFISSLAVHRLGLSFFATLRGTPLGPGLRFLQKTALLVLLAASAGTRVVSTHLLPVPANRHAFAILRFTSPLSCFSPAEDKGLPAGHRHLLDLLVPC